MLRGLALALVILLTADFPQVRLHGLLAVGKILLREEVNLVLSDGHEVRRTLLHHRCHRAEAVTSLQLLGGERRGTCNGAQTAEIDTGTVFRLRCSLAVGCEDHLLVCCVRRLLVDFGQCTADGLDCVSILYFCHSLLAMTRTTARSALV